VVEGEGEEAHLGHPVVVVEAKADLPGHLEVVVGFHCLRSGRGCQY
jgi:hypothetical protein